MFSARAGTSRVGARSRAATALDAYALSRCGVLAAEAMLVTVHPWDTDGARRAGLSAAWVNRARIDGTRDHGLHETSTLIGRSLAMESGCGLVIVP
jgi:hypothetical protein